MVFHNFQYIFFQIMNSTLLNTVPAKVLFTRQGIHIRISSHSRCVHLKFLSPNSSINRFLVKFTISSSLFFHFDMYTEIWKFNRWNNHAILTKKLNEMRRNWECNKKKIKHNKHIVDVRYYHIKYVNSQFQITLPCVASLIYRYNIYFCYLHWH